MGVVNTTYTFLGTDTITSSKLNNIIDDTTFTGDAIQGTTLQVVSPGKLAVSAGGITSNELASGSVTPAKISTGGPSWTASSISLPNPTTITGNTTVTGNATVTGETTSTGALTVGTAKMNVPSGSAPIYGARAWASFDATVLNNISGNAVRVAGSTTVTITITNHGLLTGHKVFIDFTATIVDGAYEITKVSDDVFTIVTTASTAATTAATVVRLTIRSSGNVACVSRLSNGNFTINFVTFMQSSNNYTGVFNSLRYSFFDRSQSSFGYAHVQADDGAGAGANYNTNNFIAFE
jgi:hypothetical protein